MSSVTFMLADGSMRMVEVLPGLTVMEAAVRNDLEGIDGDCGGACVCGTCHVWVDEGWASRLPPPIAVEAELLAALPCYRRNSRLCCQIKIKESLAGLVLQVPPNDR